MRKSFKRICTLMLTIALALSSLSVGVMADPASTTLAADGTATRIEFEVLGVDGMSTKTAVDPNTEGTFSGTGYAYQQNSVSGAATKTVTIPVTVTKAGTYTIDVHGSAYATKSNPANDNGHLSIKVGETEVPLTRNTTVLFGAMPSTTAYKVYSYVGEIELATDTTSVDLIYTFGGSDKFKFVLDCVDFTNTSVDAGEQEATPINVEFEDIDGTGTLMTSVSSGTYSGEGYMFEMNTVSGAATKTVTIPVAVTKAGTYAIDVHGSAYATKSDPASDSGSFAIKAGDTTVTLTRAVDPTFGALRNGTTYNVYSYTGEIELTTDMESVELIYTFTGTDKYKLVLDCMSMTFAGSEDVEPEATPIDVEFEDIDGTGTLMTSVSSGTYSGEGYMFEMNAVSGAATKTVTIPVAVTKAGTYAIDVHGSAYATKSDPASDSGSFAIKAGDTTVTLTRAVDPTFGALRNGTTYNVYSYTGEIELTTDMESVELIYTFTGTDKYKLVLDCMSMRYFDLEDIVPELVKYEFEVLGVDGMSTKTAVDPNTEGTFSGEGYLYQQNSTSGAATKTVTIPVTVTKNGTYAIDVQGSAYKANQYSQDSGSFSIKVGDITYDLTRGTDVRFGAMPVSTVYKAYSYVGEVDLTTETTSIDLVYTFTGADKYKLVLDCISIDYVEIEETTVDGIVVGDETIVEAENGATGKNVESSSASGNAFLGTDSSTVKHTMNFSVTTAGEYMIEVRGTAGVMMQLDSETVSLGNYRTLITEEGSYFAEGLYPYNTYVVMDAIDLTAGNHTLTLTVRKNAIGTAVDYIKFVKIEEPTGLALDDIDELTVGETANVAIAGINVADMYQVTYASDEESVATVDGNGVVTANGAGTATITVIVKKYAISEGIELTTTVTVASSEVVTVSDAAISNGTFTATIKKNSALDRASNVYIAVYESESDAQMKYIKVLDISNEIGTLPVNETLNVSSGNVVRMFVWGEDLYPWCNPVNVIVE